MINTTGFLRQQQFAPFTQTPESHSSAPISMPNQQENYSLKQITNCRRKLLTNKGASGSRERVSQQRNQSANGYSLPRGMAHIQMIDDSVNTTYGGNGTKQLNLTAVQNSRVMHSAAAGFKRQKYPTNDGRLDSSSSGRQGITIIQTPHVNNINNYHNYNINRMTFNQEFDTIGNACKNHLSSSLMTGSFMSPLLSQSVPSPLVMMNNS